MGNACFAANGSRNVLQIQHKEKKEKSNNSSKLCKRAYIPHSKNNISKDFTSTGTNLNCYELGRELGHGAYGVIYLCTHRETGRKFACKVVPKKKLHNDSLRENMRREIEIMQRLPSHPNLISLKTVYYDYHLVYLVMELCEGGQLIDRITERGHYSERCAIVVAKAILEAIQVCHEHGLMHRDLKPQNFLFADGSKTAPLKLIDFGFSVNFTPGQKFSDGVGSPLYVAPEVYYQNYGPEADMWSAGVIIYQLLCGVPPFSGENERELAMAIIESPLKFESELWAKVSKHAKDLIRGLLNRDPKK